MSAARPTVVLFDVDGTLVSTGGAGRRAIEGAFAARYGRPDACSHFGFDGMTDRAIARLGLTAISVEPTGAAIDAVLNVYLDLLAEAVRRVPDADYLVHRGMREAVAACQGAGLALGLGTGNVREGARLKLERVGLYAPFAFGGFGDDAEERTTLIRQGALRGAASLERELSDVRVVIVGDTPKDVAAAQALGAESLAVATGRFDLGELGASGATWAFEDLASPGALEALLGR